MPPEHVPLVTFLALSYNHGRFIRDCLDSILSQEDAPDFEVVVVDDASTDGSQRILREYELRDSRLRVILHDHNLGHIQTVTDGLEATRGAYVARIDSDDRYRPDYLKHVLPVLQAHPSVGLVFAKVALMDEAGITTPAGSHGRTAWRGSALVSLLEENFVCAATVIARRQAWVEALPIPHGLAFHDWYFTVMIARHHDFQFVDRVLADYRVHGGNLHTAIARDGTEEQSIFRLLSQVMGESERTPLLQQTKLAAKGRIYAHQYMTLADKYFGMRMTEDARRCYLAAVRNRPAYLFRADLLRHLGATLFNRDKYEHSKRFAKAMMHSLSRNG